MLYSVVCISPIVIPYLHVIWVGRSLFSGSLGLGSLVRVLGPTELQSSARNKSRHSHHKWCWDAATRRPCAQRYKIRGNMYQKNDPLYEVNWLQSSRKSIQEYFQRQNLGAVKVESTASWHVCPYVSIWKAVKSDSVKEPQYIWAIAGDLPTDYISDISISCARDALKEFSKRWLEDSVLMLAGKAPIHGSLGNPNNWVELGELLQSREEILREWSLDDNQW